MPENNTLDITKQSTFCCVWLNELIMKFAVSGSRAVACTIQDGLTLRMVFPS